MQGFSVSLASLIYDDGMAMGRPPKSERSEFGERLAAARQQLGLTQSQVAERLGITQQSYAGWERRQTALKPEHLVSLAGILEVSVEHLLGQEEPRKRNGGPAGRLRQVFERASRLPRHQQNKIAEFVEAFVAQHRQKNAA
ncbi:MAG: helix-turn-helix transcriptional regulator [Verrucomicrobiales bacterium]|nr:helix-turn-helix transcriptional regulator [Verrucomicrobiales bacterium]